MIDQSEVPSDEPGEAPEPAVELVGDDIFEDWRAVVSGRLRRMYITKGARFEASRRHKLAARASNYSIVVLSTWIFAFSLLTLSVDEEMSDFLRLYLGNVSLVLSFFVLSFSLLQANKKHDLRADLYSKCAHDIDAVHAALSSEWKLVKSRYLLRGAAPSAGEHLSDFVMEAGELVTRIDGRYHDILKGFPDNHGTIDHHIFFYKTQDGRPGSAPSTRLYLWRSLKHLAWRAIQMAYINSTIIIAFLFPLVALAIYPCVRQAVTTL